MAVARSGATPLLKDPIAFFSAEWLERTFGMRVVVTVRHPAAFAASLKRMDWRFDFNRFLEQPSLMRDHLDPYRTDITRFANHPPEIVAQAGLLWRCIHGPASNLRDAHTNWLFVRPEKSLTQPH